MFANHVIGLARQGVVDSIVGGIVPADSQITWRRPLTMAVRILAAQARGQPRLIGFDIFKPFRSNTYHISSIQHVRLTYVVDAEDGWIVVTIGVLEENQTELLEQLSVQQVSASVARNNALFSADVPAPNYLVLLFAGMDALFMVGVACLAIRRLSRRRWWWALLSFVTVSQLLFNWTTGYWMVRPLWFGLFSVGMARAAGAPFMPWIVSLPPPIGAVIVLERVLRYRKDLALRSTSATEVEAPT